MEGGQENVMTFRQHTRSGSRGNYRPPLHLRYIIVLFLPIRVVVVINEQPLNAKIRWLSHSHALSCYFCCCCCLATLCGQGGVCVIWL